MEEFSGACSRTPTLDEYDRTKKEMEIHVDPAVPGGDITVESVVDLNTLLLMYWTTIPNDEKRVIEIGDTHGQNKFPT